jgi:hypothetical protein
MKSFILGWVVMSMLMALLAVGTFYAQEHGTGQQSKMDMPKKAEVSGAPEIFCSRMGTGQLCPGNAQMFNLSGAKKERYEEALNGYNKTVAAAQKQFLADAKDKVALSPAELALTKSWFDVGLNPEINRILATRNNDQKITLRGKVQQ